MKNLFFMRQDEKKKKPLAISTQDFFQKNNSNPRFHYITILNLHAKQFFKSEKVENMIFVLIILNVINHKNNDRLIRISAIKNH